MAKPSIYEENVMLEAVWTYKYLTKMCSMCVLAGPQQPGSIHLYVETGGQDYAHQASP